MKNHFVFRVNNAYGILAISPHFSSCENCMTTAYFFSKCLQESHKIDICEYDCNGHLVSVIITIKKDL
jgi:hypothetical protein